MSNSNISPKEKKELLINTLVDKFEKDLTSSMYTTFTTCKDAPAFGWSVEEYMYMPQVANILRDKGYTVRSEVNWGVTDWYIAV